MEENKIKVVLKRNEEYGLSIWEISRFLNRFNTFHYKYLLLQAIEKELSAGNVLAENIFIIDGSFKVDNIYDKLDGLDLMSRDIMQLLYIGKPVSLYPSKYGTELYGIFSLVENIRSKMPKYGFSLRDSAEILQVAFSMLLEDGFDAAVSAVRLYFGNYLHGNDGEGLDELDKIINSIQKNVSEFNKIEGKINIEKKDLIDKTTIGDNRLGKHFEKFDYYFNRVNRPIIFILDPETHKIRLLVDGQVNKRKMGDDFPQLIDFKKINPDFVTMLIGAAAGPIITKMLNANNEKLDKLKKEEEITLIQEQQKTEILKQELLIKELEAIKEKQIISDEGRKINNSYLDHKLHLSRMKLEEQAGELSRNHKFRIIEIEVRNGIDIRI